MDDEFQNYAGDDFFGDNNNDGNDSDNDDFTSGEKEVLREESTLLNNPKSVRERIDETLEVLADFKNRSDQRLSRQDLVSTLSKDLSEYYGYIPELADFLLELFSPAECVEYMDASDRPRPLVIRTNTLKTTRKDLMDALTKRGAVVEAIDWSKVAIKVTESSVPIGATPEYLAGQYMLQSAASMNPVMALAPQPGERVLDMSAAPGGKTSYISQLMKNSGIVIANDLKPQRQKATVANLHRLGIKNSIACCYDGRKIPSVMKGFDRVLLDAPCSGLGVIARDQSVKLQRTVKDIQRIAHLQKELLCAAVDAAAVASAGGSGGIVVYSTCSISCEENEQVVQYILSKRHVRLIDSGLSVGRPGFTRFKERRFHPSLALTRRFYPHVHNMDGFFVAKLQKYAHGPKESENEDESDNEESSDVSDEEEEEEEDEEGEGSEEEEEEEEEEAVVDLPLKRKQSSIAAAATKPIEKPAVKAVKAPLPSKPTTAVPAAAAVVASDSEEDSDSGNEDDEDDLEVDKEAITKMLMQKIIESRMRKRPKTITQLRRYLTAMKAANEDDSI